MHVFVFSNSSCFIQYTHLDRQILFCVFSYNLTLNLWWWIVMWNLKTSWWKLNLLLFWCYIRYAESIVLLVFDYTLKNILSGWRLSKLWQLIQFCHLFVFLWGTTVLFSSSGRLNLYHLCASDVYEIYLIYFIPMTVQTLFWTNLSDSWCFKKKYKEILEIKVCKCSSFW